MQVILHFGFNFFLHLIHHLFFLYSFPGVINSVLLDENSNFGEDIFRLVKLEIKGQKNIYKHVAGIHVFCQLIQVCFIC